MEMNDKFIKKTMIPFALVNNKVKGIENITKLDIPVCLECGEILILRNGEKNIKHLAHKSDSKCIYKEVFKQNSNQETYEHKFAKEFIKDNLTYFREYMNEIVVKDGEFKLGGYKDLKVENIEIEYRGLKKDLSLSREYIPDILIKTKDKLIALEIYMSNKKDPIVLKDILKNKNISVYEVDIRKIPELTIQNIFKHMKLIYSDLKVDFENSIRTIQNIIIERDRLLKEQNIEKISLEIWISSLEAHIKQLEDDKRKLNLELNELRNEDRIDYKTYQNLKGSNKELTKQFFENTKEIKKLKNEIKNLNMKIKEYEKLHIDNLKWQIDMQKHRISLLLEKIEELKKL